MKAVVVGASGRSGSAMVRELVQSNEYEAVIAVGHSRLPRFTEELPSVTCIQSPLAELVHDPTINAFQGVGAVFFAVGTQKRKSGLAAQIKLEVDDTIAAAKAARTAGVQLCGIVTCAGANANHMVTYLKSKGRVEKALRDLAFPALVIARPGLIVGGDRGPAPTSLTVRMLRLMGFATCPFERIAKAVVRKGAELRAAARDSTSTSPTTVVVLENPQLTRLGQ